MKHIQRFDEKINWSKLNIFSSKKKEDLKRKEEVNKDDESLANAIYSEISGKVNGRSVIFADDISGDGIRSGMTFEYDGDKITSYTNSVMINGQTLKCSKETAGKFQKLFRSKKDSFLQGSRTQ